MRIAIVMLVAGLVLTGTAFAQGEWIAEKISAEVIDSVVSIDSNAVSYGEVLGQGALELGRQIRLTTSYITGFVYTSNGYIITDSQDIENATLLTVRMADGSELDAELVGVDTEYGVGVLKVSSEKPLKPVKILNERYSSVTNSYPYDQGDPVLAVGNSGGYGGTVTSGVISAIRNFRNRNGILLPSVIQTDAAINAGNEGCPLIDAQGRVIAMHDRRGGGGSMQNTTFFTPIWLIVRVADELIAAYEQNKSLTDVEVWHPWLGIKPFTGSLSPLSGQYREVGDDLKMYMDIPDQYWDVGVLLDDVWQESPAREFGLLPRDMLLDVEVHTVDEDVKVPYRLLKTVEELEIMVTTADRGDVFVFGVLRNYTYFKVEVIVGQHPGSFSTQAQPGAIQGFINEYF